MKFLTEKFSWMIENPTGTLKIPEGLLPMDSADSVFCSLTKYCSDEKHDDFCGSPLGDEMREQYCIRYREIKKSLVQVDLKDRSRSNKLVRENPRGYAFVKTPSSHGGGLD